MTTCAVPAAQGGQSGIEMKLTFTQVTLASGDDGTYALNNPEELSEEDILNITSTVNQ